MLSELYIHVSSYIHTYICSYIVQWLRPRPLDRLDIKASDDSLWP